MTGSRLPRVRFKTWAVVFAGFAGAEFWGLWMILHRAPELPDPLTFALPFGARVFLYSPEHPLLSIAWILACCAFVAWLWVILWGVAFQTRGVER